MGKGAKARAKAVSKAAARKRLEDDEIEEGHQKQIKQEREQVAQSADPGRNAPSATNVGSTSPSKKAKIEHVETIPIHSDDEEMVVQDAQDRGGEDGEGKVTPTQPS